jgi:tetratricopeptide (TPR) repeat protein
MRRVQLPLACFFLACLAATGQPPTQPGQSPDRAGKANPLDAEDLKDLAIAERFQKVLEGNPRRGTAFDRLYGYYVERGLLDKLVANYATRTQKDAKDGVAWMIIGILESQRGRDAAAVAAFKRAETSRPSDALAPYYLGQSLILVGQPEPAAEAFERAIHCKPNRNDLLDIFQALGRVYQRAQRAEKALDVWSRLEKQFPDDARVQEQIATTLIEEGQFDQALPRLVKLADQTDDKYRQSSLRMDIADLKVKLKRTSEALVDFEKILGELNPDSWLYRDVRRRTEEVFLRNDDLAGMAKYYEQWLKNHPTDVDAIARLAKTLSTQGRAPEAKTWLTKGVTAAPSHRGLRQALIDQFVVEQNFAAAEREYEAMDKANPNNPDILRDWGKLRLNDISKSESERRANAAKVWKRLLDKKPNDPVIVSQVADLMRTANAVDEAMALYKKAIALAPGAAQYREYLGEYLHSLNRHEEALATWRPIAEGASRTSKNLARLAEVFAGFGYRKEAVAAMADAISLDKEDFTLLMTYAELLHQEGRNDEALAQIAVASRRTSNPEEEEQVLLAQIKVFQAAETLGDRINELQADLDAGKEATAERWLRLARYYEANRQADKASETISVALDKNARSIPALIAAARIYELSGNLLIAAEANRKLAALDRRYRTEYLTTVAKLEQRLGRREQAMLAGRDLLAASPGNPDVYKFFADLCFQLGDQEEGLEALRRSVRANPSDPQGLIILANALAERVRQGEAIELLWRAFEKTNELDAKLGVVERITTLYLENNQFDRLLERLERERREADKAREITLCIAQAYTTAGDLGTARQKLENLLTENTRDTHLLTQLGLLSEQEGDVPAAIKYQRQLLGSAPNNYDGQHRLAQLLTRSGESDEAADIWVKLAANETEPHRNLASIDSLFTAGKHDTGLAILNRLLARKPGSWELLYREGAALEARSKTDEAAKRFQALLALNLSDDELSENAKYQIKQAKKKQQLPSAPANNAGAAARYDDWSNPPLVRRKQNVYQMRRAIGMETNYGGGMQPFYGPSDYGEARMACLGWLYEAARSRGEMDEFAARQRKAKDKAGADSRPLWDWYYFQSLRNERKDVLPTVLTLSKGADPAGLLALLQELGDARRGNRNQNGRAARNEEKDNTPPLLNDQLDHALASFRKLKQIKPDWATSAVTTALLTELRRAKRSDEEKAVYRGIVEEANTLSKVSAALPVAADRKDVETCVELFGRLERLQPPVKNASGLGQLPSRQAHYTFVTLMGRLAEEKRLAEARKVLDLYLASVRRQNLTAPRSASSTRAIVPQTTAIRLYSPNQNYRQIQIDYPQANEYFDNTAITLLYNAFELHKRADLLTDLFAHFRKQLDAAQGAEKQYLQMGTGYVHWWVGEKDEALALLNAAVQAAPSDHGLLIDVATLRERNNEFDAALALLDSITPLNTQMMQRREEAAMRLAERTGNLERARQAAERLFGLRLDPDKQLELASRMHRLGLPEMAETVLSRAQRQSGSKTATLLRLMSQYQSQNQTDQAVQIARQILRKGPSYNANSRRGGDENDSARRQAIGVLARSGNLKEMTERAEAQLKVSPNSIQIHQALVGFYQAAGEKAKLKATLLKMVELKPTDGKLRYTVAEELQQAGEREAALDQYKIALKLDPAVFAQNYWQIQNWFAEADRFEELAALFDEVDLRKFGYYWYIVEPIASLLRDDRSRELGLKLFKKAWEAYPQNRGEILAELQDASIWRLPEIYTYSKQAIIPREDSEIDPWQSANEFMNGGQDGRVESVITKMMSIARKQQRLPELRLEVASALAKRPDWTLGKALLAVIDIQSGDKERGKAQWREAFDNPKEDVPAIARFIFCQELEFYAGCEAMAVKTLEAGIDDLFKEGDYNFSWGPGRRLVWWYEQLGRADDAKKLLIRFATPDESNNPGYNGNWWYYRNVEDAIGAAQALQAMGDPVEAVRVYGRLLADKETLDLALQQGGENLNNQIRSGLQSAVKAIRPATLPAALNSLLTPRQPTAGLRVLDLVLLIESRSLTKATVTSLVATALKSAEKAPAIRLDALAKLAGLSQKYPTDFSVQTATAFAALSEEKLEAKREAVDRLLKLAESTPLEPLLVGTKANSRQRAEALAQVPLWLVARECLAKDRQTLWPVGEKLAGRAVEAAKRQQDLQLATAILREWGEIELDRDDKTKAEARWKELLDLVVPKPAARKVAVAPLPDADAFVTVSVQVPPASKSAAPAARTNIAMLTADQFQKAYELATLAADKGMPALSLTIMREAVRGGPPIVEAKGRKGGGGGPWQVRVINGVQYLVPQNSSRTTDIDKALVALAPKWAKLQVSAAEIYDVLAAAVLPEGRPAEVFLYNEGETLGSVYRLVGGIWTPTDEALETEGAENGLTDVLVRIAIEAGKADDLRTRTAARAGQPLGELPGKLLLTTLSLKTKDEARTTPLLEALGQRAKKDSLQSTNNRIAAVALSAFAQPQYAKMLAPILEKLAENHAVGSNNAKAVELRFKLAQYHLAQKDEAAARAQYKIVAGFGMALKPGGYDPHLPQAKEYLKAGWVEDALSELGVHVDNLTTAGADPRGRAHRAEPTIDLFPWLVRLLLEMPADKRYQALKTWSLPTAQRKSVRYFVDVMPDRLPPPSFVKLPPLPMDEVVSTMVLLAEAARQSGKLDELTAEAEKLAAEKVENADLLRLLVALVEKKGKQIEPLVKDFAFAMQKRIFEKPEARMASRYYRGMEQNQGPAFRPSELLCVSLCLGDPALAKYGEMMLGSLRMGMLFNPSMQGANPSYSIRVRELHDRLVAARAGAPDATKGGMPSRWQAAPAQSVWFAQDGYLTHVGRNDGSYLLLDKPLEGTFEFSVEAWHGFGGGSIGYGGVFGGQSSVSSVGGDSIFRPVEALRPLAFNRLTVQVSPGKVRYLANGQLFYEETDCPPTAPWLMLGSGANEGTAFRNVEITGKPEVLQEVKLTAGNFVEGWTAAVHGGKLPQRMMLKDRERGEPSFNRGRMEDTEEEMGAEPVYDWRAQDGELLGRKLAQPGTRAVPSCLAYFRPLRPGETVRYEFFHEPGKTHVHPSLGRLAFLIEKDGVRLHWMTLGAADDWMGLQADNAIDDPAGRRGKVVLKAGAWNALTLTATPGGVKIEVNGALVYESQLDPAVELTFGLFHYRDQTAARVRNVVLTGPWTKEVGTSQEVALTAKPASPAVAVARRRLLGERYYASEAPEVVARAMKLPPAERYKMLADWVLPTPFRPSFQLAGKVQPRDVLGTADQKLAGQRVLLGGQFVIPALDMIDAAKDCGALEELCQRIAQLSTTGPDEVFARSKDALLAVARGAQGQDAAAIEAIRKLAKIAAGMPVGAPPSERWPDLIAVLGTASRPALRQAAAELADAENKNIEESLTQKRPFEERDWWMRAFRAARVQAEPPAAPLAFWTPVVGLTAESRSEGWGVPVWAARGASVVHFPGHDNDYLILRTPLRGDFEVTCGLSLQRWQDAQIRYGSFEFELSHDSKKYRLYSTVRHEGWPTTISPPLPPAKGDTYQFRLSVKDGWFRALVDGREIAAEKIGPNPDPWLMIHVSHDNTAAVQDLKITGNPTVPDRIDLLIGDDLGMWRLYFGGAGFMRQAFQEEEGEQQAERAWIKRGEEMYSFGKKPDPPEEGRPEQPRNYPESAIYYQRPFVENGAVEYEFFYDPDKALVHPALDRLTFLLEADGFKLHWLTDGHNEKSQVPFDNSKDEPECRRGPAKLPLKAKEWNKVQLVVAGDTVKLILNDTLVYERAIEPTNQRLFGLFHYTDRTEARVRGLILTGDWPREVPSGNRLFELIKP